MQTYNDYILALPSWYPSKIHSTDGDFVQRHVQAISIYQKQIVVFVKKDEKGIVANNVATEIIEHTNYTEHVTYYKPFKIGISFINKLISQKKYIKLYKKEINKIIATYGKPKLVHVHVAYKAGILALWLKRKMQLQFVVTEHWAGFFKNARPNFFESNFLQKNYTKKIFSEAKMVFPVTKNLGEQINNAVAKTRYLPIPNVVETNFFKFKENANQQFTFLHASYLNYQKNIEGIISASRRLADEGLDFKVILIGNKPQHLLDLATSLNLLNTMIFFKDAVNYKDVAIEMQNANALLMFSRFENLPCIILEALCCGLPIISTNVGGIAEILDGSNSILVENENVNELVLAMKQIITEYSNYDRQEIAKNATQQFNYNSIGSFYNDKLY